MSRQAQYLSIWAICSFIAALIALQLTSASYAEGVWVPAGNDSFYHARRILDAAESPDGLYQFDKSIHVPEGSWLTWPWAYDWGMAKALQAVKALSPSTDSMAFLTHVPVYWVFVNVALLVGVLVILGLPWHWSALVTVAYAVSPLTQLLHGVGMIDHHFIEHCFVLLTLFTGLWWLKDPGKVWRAALLGITLGIAPAFHTGLFILQVPMLFCLFVLWLRDGLPPRETVLALATSIVLATAAALLPSEPFREGQFQFSVLSWFHLYIAAISTLLIASFARFSFSMMKLVILAVTGIALLIPIWGETIGGTAFLTREISLLDRVMEARSPIQMLADKGWWEAISYYTPIGLLVPLLIPVYIYRGWQTRDGVQLFLSVMVVFGVLLLLVQFRLHYFGSFALILGWVLLVSEKLDVSNRKPLLTFGVGLLVLALAFQPAAKDKLFIKYALGLDPGYQDVYTLFAPLAERCRKNPGIALADNNFGHYIRFHTECTVIANNFLMTPQHEEKIAVMEHLLELSPEELLEEAPEDTRYVFSRMLKFYGIRNGEAALTSTEYVKENTPRLYFELNSRDDLPERFRVVGELPLDSSRGLTRARVVEILPARGVGDD